MSAVALLLALALPTLAQTSPPASSTAKPVSTKPVPTKPDADATPTAPVAASKPGACIGVIPHIGEHLGVNTIGITRFTNESKVVPIPSWGLDDIVVARVQAAAGTRITVRRFAFPNDKVYRWSSHPEDGLKSVVQAVGRGGGCERYVVVVPGMAQLANVYLGGVGVANRRGLVVSPTYLYAVPAIYVFDGRTFELLKKGTGQNVFNSLLGIDPVHGMAVVYNDFPWPPPPERLMGLRDQARALLVKSLDRALPDMLAK